MRRLKECDICFCYQVACVCFCYKVSGRNLLEGEGSVEFVRIDRYRG